MSESDEYGDFVGPTFSADYLKKLRSKWRMTNPTSYCPNNPSYNPDPYGTDPYFKPKAAKPRMPYVPVDPPAPIYSQCFYPVICLPQIPISQMQPPMYHGNPYGCFSYPKKSRSMINLASCGGYPCFDTDEFTDDQQLYSEDRAPPSYTQRRAQHAEDIAYLDLLEKEEANANNADYFYNNSFASKSTMNDPSIHKKFSRMKAKLHTEDKATAYSSQTITICEGTQTVTDGVKFMSVQTVLRDTTKMLLLLPNETNQLKSLKNFLDEKANKDKVENQVVKDSGKLELKSEKVTIKLIPKIDPANMTTQSSSTVKSVQLINRSRSRSSIRKSPAVPSK